MTNGNKKRKIAHALMPLLLAAVLCLSLISSVLASDYNDTSAGRSAQINILNLFDENGQIITDETGLINLDLSVRSENIGIQSVNFTIISDGQSGQECVMVQTIEANGIKVQEPPVNWTVQEANAENIISLRRTVETYALQTLTVELGFTDINGNYYSEQYYGIVAPQIVDIPQDICNAQEFEMDHIAQEEYAVSEQSSETNAATEIEELTETEVMAEIDPLVETELIPENAAPMESEVKTEADATIEIEELTETETLTEPESASREESEIISTGVTAETDSEGLTIISEDEADQEISFESTDENESGDKTPSTEADMDMEQETSSIEETETMSEPEASGDFNADSDEQAEPETEITMQEESGSIETAAEVEIIMPESEFEEEQSSEAAAETETESITELETEIIAETESEPESETETETEAESELQTTIPESSTQQETTAAALQETGSNIQYVYVPQYVYKPTTAASAGTYSAASSTRSQAVSTQNSSRSQSEKTSESDDTLINDARSKAKELEAEADSLEETTKESTPESKQLNKEGSTYDLSAIEGINGRSLKEAGDIVVCEQNKDKLVEDSIKVTVSKNDETYELEKDTDYSVMLTGNSENKKIYKYTVNADTFKEDGRYKIFIYSEDESGNTNSNEIKDSSIEFSVDNTNPLIMDCSDPKAVNAGSSGEMIIKDNIQLEEVDIYVDDQKIDYDVDGETYSFSIPESEKEANVKVVAKDAAGNVYERTFEGYKAAGNATVKSKSNAVFIIAAAIFVLAAGILTVKIKAKRR